MQSQIERQKKRGIAREWITVKECSSKEDTDKWMDENGGSWIRATMRIRYAKDLMATSKAFIQTSEEYDHELKDTGLSSPVKMSTEKKDEPCGGMTARVIQRKLKKELELSGISRRHNKFRKHLRQYYELHKQIPEDLEKTFVVVYKDRIITTREDGVLKFTVQFIMVFSSLKLLRRQVFWPVMQVDGTYKLMTLNYPLLVCGFSDADKRFFPTAAAISSHEGKWSYAEFMRAISKWDPERLYQPIILIADGAPAIKSACSNELPSASEECAGSMFARISIKSCQSRKSMRMRAMKSRKTWQFWHEQPATKNFMQRVKRL
uniref:MULE transposase domain-containing protein n=1 Tax=Ditylenchus dipsaci TaxID=166011 RepID=A0A915EPN4_9BILA